MRRCIIIPVINLILISCGDRNDASPADNVTPNNPIINSPDTALVIADWGKETDTLRSSQGWLDENKVNLSLENKTTYESYYLDLETDAGNWKIRSISQQSLTDCLYVASTFQILNQLISLNKSQFNAGEMLNGSIDLIMLGKRPMFREPLIPFIDKRKWDTVRLKGTFSLILK